MTLRRLIFLLMTFRKELKMKQKGKILLTSNFIVIVQKRTTRIDQAILHSLHLKLSSKTVNKVRLKQMES
jgi:hypothetical protein